MSSETQPAEPPRTSGQSEPEAGQNRPSMETRSWTEKGTEDGDVESIKPARVTHRDVEAQASNYEPQIGSDIPLPPLDTVISGPDNEGAASVHTRRSIASRISRIASIRNVGNPSNQGKSVIPAAPVPVTKLDEGVVGWDSKDDPEYPLNFTSRKKWTIMTFLTIITFMTPFASSMPAPAITYFQKDFGVQDLTIASMPVTIYLIGYAVGPLFLAPLSEIYGRHLIMTLANVVFCVFQIGCALAPTLPALIVFRLFAGIGGSACFTIGGGIVADLFPTEERALALSFWIMGPTVGPVIGPLIGAFIAESIGWRWGFWVVLVPGTLATIVMGVWSSETNHRVLVSWRVKKLRKELGRNDLRSSYDGEKGPEDMRTVLLNGAIRPLKMLFMAPVLTAISLYVAFGYGLLYLLFNTIPLVFVGDYGWPIRLTGLVYISLGLGYIIGLVIFAMFSDKQIVRMTQRNNGVYEPEMRLLECFQWACLLPITFFWYGWTTYYHVHWIVPIIGLFPFALAMMCIWQPCQAYIVDAYGGAHAASGLAAFTTVRSLVGAFLPLAGPEMYAKLGLGWGNSLLGFLCLALAPIPWFIFKHGERIRKSRPLKL